jgi:hypothetical protein
MAYKPKLQNGKNGLTEEEKLGPPGAAELLAKVRRQLEEGQAEAALESIERSRIKSDWITNAAAVCLLRMGEAKRAADAFRRLCGGPGGVTLRNDAPMLFKTNFAAALFADGNIHGCLSVLAEIGDEHNATVRTLRSSITQWKRGLSVWQKFKWYTGDVPNHPVTLDFTPGDLGA